MLMTNPTSGYDEYVQFNRNFFVRLAVRRKFCPGQACA